MLAQGLNLVHQSQRVVEVSKHSGFGDLEAEIVG